MRSDDGIERWEFHVEPEFSEDCGSLIFTDVPSNSELVEKPNVVRERLTEETASSNDFVFKFSDQPILPTYVLADDPDRL